MLDEEKIEVLPFKHNEKWAKKCFNIHNKNFISLLSLKDSSKCELKISKVYVPFYKYETESVIDCIVETRRYDEGYEMRGEYERKISANLEILHGANKKIDETLISYILPYNLKKVINIEDLNDDCERLPFSYDPIREVEWDIRENMKALIANEDGDRVKFLKSDCNSNFIGTRKLLLPLWMIEDETGTILYLNDQNGKWITNDLRSVNWIMKYSLLVAVFFMVYAYISIKKGWSYYYLIVLSILSIFCAIFARKIAVSTKEHVPKKYVKAKIYNKKIIRKK